MAKLPVAGREITSFGIVQIAAIPGMGGSSAPIEKILGVGLPGIQHSAVVDGLTVLWTGPAQWWVLTAREQVADLINALDAVVGDGFAVLDLSASRRVFRLTGAAARTVLSSGSGVDFHRRSFTAGMTVATGLARLSAVIHARQDAESFDIFVYRSFGRELEEWLAEASTGFREPPGQPST